MKKTTTNKLSMYQNVHEVMSDYQNAWQSIPAFAAAITKFNDTLDLMKIRLSEQSSTTTGVTADKDQRINDLRERMVVVQRALMLYGRSIGDVMLKERNKGSKSGLLALSIHELVARCTELKLDLETYGHQLSDYGLNTNVVAQLVDQLTTVAELGNSPRKAILKRKHVTESIRDLEHKLDELLHIDLDNLMLVFTLTNPEFYHAFRNARVVVDYRGARHKAPLEPDDGTLE